MGVIDVYHKGHHELSVTLLTFSNASWIDLELSPAHAPPNKYQLKVHETHLPLAPNLAVSISLVYLLPGQTNNVVLEECSSKEVAYGEVEAKNAN